MPDAPELPPLEARSPDADQYEPLPPWLAEEIAQGSSFELRLKLRKALIQAIKEITGVIRQLGQNTEQGYTYTGHEHVMAHVRASMAKHGVTIDQPLLEFERVINMGKDRTRWQWRVVCLVIHDEGGILVRIVRPITIPNDKASFVASTAADRVVMMRLMRIAGTKEDPEAQSDGHQGASSSQHGQHVTQQGQQQRGGTAQPNTRPKDRAAPQISPEQMVAAEQMLKSMLVDLESCTSSEKLVDWARIFRYDIKLPQAVQKRGWDAWGTACKAGKYDPSDLAAQATAAGPLGDVEAEARAAEQAAANETLSGQNASGQEFEIDPATGETKNKEDSGDQAPLAGTPESSPAQERSGQTR